MVTSTRRILAVVARSALAACGGNSRDQRIGSTEAAHEVPSVCNFDTPGFWCGGASTAQEWQCVEVGFESCAEMCQCFKGANAAPFVDLDACPSDCGGTRAGGMADMLDRAWGAYRLSAMTQCTVDGGLTIIPEFICPGADCGQDPTNPDICWFPDVEAALLSCDRGQQELLKNCLDTILNAGGQCTYTSPFTCVPREE